MTGRRNKDAAEPSAYQRALGLLARREHSRKELKRKLTDKGVAPDDADAALEVLGEQNFQNEGRFAAALARTRASSGYGPTRIRAELGTHGLSRDSIETALQACECDWDARALDLLARRYAGKSLSDPIVRRKALDFLLRRGFELATARAASRVDGRTE